MSACRTAGNRLAPRPNHRPPMRLTNGPLSRFCAGCQRGVEACIRWRLVCGQQRSEWRTTMYAYGTPPLDGPAGCRAQPRSHKPPPPRTHLLEPVGAAQAQEAQEAHIPRRHGGGGLKPQGAQHNPWGVAGRGGGNSGLFRAPHLQPCRLPLHKLLQRARLSRRCHASGADPPLQRPLTVKWDRGAKVHPQAPLCVVTCDVLAVCHQVAVLIMVRNLGGGMG